MRYVTVKRFSDLSGYTESAVRTKISEGVWLEGDVWKRAPDGRVLIDVDGYTAWVERGPGHAFPPVGSSSPRPPANSRRGRSKSPPPLTAP